MKNNEEDDCEIIGGVILSSEFALRSGHKDVELKWTIQLFNGQTTRLYFDLNMVNPLFNRFRWSCWEIEPCTDFTGIVLQVLIPREFKESPLGTLCYSGNIKAIRNSIHDEWLYL